MGQLLDNQDEQPPSAAPSWAKSQITDDDYGDQAVSVATPDVDIRSQKRDKEPAHKKETETSAPRGAGLNINNLQGDSDHKL